MRRLSKIGQQTRLSMLIAFPTAMCLVVIGSLISGEAAPADNAAESVAAYEFKVAAEPTPFAVARMPLVRPVSVAIKSQTLRVLKPYGRLYDFVSETATPDNISSSPDRADPRLQRVGRSWTFSNAFHASVGADPWAIRGVGFPNVETHGPSVQTDYKPYRAVVDWKRVDSGEGDWKPVPAVYCMGLTSQQIAERASKHERQILSYAIEYGISASLIKAVITKESCFDTKAVSSVGAEGLMQLMPETARWLKVTDRNDVSQNLSAGIRYLADLRKRFGTEELALAAYNAGPGNVERHGGIPPFKETQQYVVSVMENYRLYVAASRFENQRVSY